MKHFTFDTDAGVRDRRRPLPCGDPKAAAAVPAAAVSPGRENRRVPKLDPRLPNADLPWEKARAAAEVSIPLGV